uniref:Uncharacterized protein n=1 Tax=Phaeomonas parva TaxID=124430 RepID=A0A7S1XMA2_9STRA|mmetsp:Transcript_21389/g.65289  ORF Transcript_21389/g.65289 Transcript_21389/m.65289 type:complete len:147 (+) Transcript_21389:43-483(+)
MARLALLLALASLGAAAGFAPSGARRCVQWHAAPLRMAQGENEEKGFFGKFFEELDNFIDDATSRRLGNGASFYGKRKSSFYGENDSMKKINSKEANPLEDYQGPTNTGYFVWRKNDDGSLEAQTRMKGTRIEKPMWDRGQDRDDD